MKTASLNSFLDFLNGLDAKGFQSDKVDCFFRDNLIPTEEFLPYMFFREDTYGRNLVAKNDFYELIVLTWLPQQRTRIHNHSGQRCWMGITVGTLTVKNYATPKTDCCDLVSLGQVETCCEGNCVYVDDDIAVHSICNASRKPAVSVHLYAGPIPKCKIYNEAAKRFEWVELQYFTQYGIAKEGLPASELTVL